MTKNELRLKYKKLRSQTSDADSEKWSLEIANNVLKMDIWKHSYYHVYLPIITHNEVITEFLLHVLSGKDKEIVISKSNFSNLKMTHFLLTDNTKIGLNSYGIPEPINGLEIPVSKIEVVFVPLLAYDIYGNRVGYGKGFYDQFLAACHPKVVKIGLSFFEPEAKINGVFETDIQLNFCVTPNKIWEFR